MLKNFKIENLNKITFLGFIVLSAKFTVTVYQNI